MKKILTFILILFATQIIFARSSEYSRIKIWFDGKQPAELAKLGLDLTEGEFRQGVWFVSDFSKKEISEITNAGFRTEVLIPDVTSYYVNRNNSPSINSVRSNPCQTSPDYPVPANFHLGSMGGFYTYDEMVDILDSMSLLYPNLISQKQPIDVTNSIEGHPIYYLRISDNASVDEAEPEVMYDAVHHAREPESMSQLIYYMWYLLENYSTDTTVKALVDNTEMYFIPCVNPDGYMYNEMTDPQGGGMWRKNRRDNLDGEFGVDLNRNYDWQWGLDTLGSSPTTFRETYRGTTAFSEPETQAMRNFLNSRHILFTLNYHTYGEHNIIPWGYIPNLQTPDSIAYEYYGNAITRYNEYLVGTTNQTLNYLVNGVADDWMYGEQTSKQKIFSMTPEVGNNNDGFWPQPSRIIPLSQENMYANLMLAKLAGRYGIIEHNQPHYTAQINNQFVFSFRQIGLDTTGSYTIYLTPLSSNIISFGSPSIISNLSVLQAKSDSISFGLNPAILPGDEIRYLIVIHNGLYFEGDTITQIYGTPVSILIDDASNINNWNIGGSTWGVTTEDFVSPPSSITDSPFNLYLPNSDFSMIGNQINLSGALDARLTFFTKWNTERHYDWVQVSASTNNGSTWTPLCGKYTKEALAFQIQGQPDYDGTQTDWVQEEMSLNDFLGQTVRLKFQIVTDNFQEFDGFYIDDLNVEIIQNNIGIDESPNSSIYISSSVPNPSSDFATVNYSNLTSVGTFELYNTFGQIVWRKSQLETRGKIEIPVSKFATGMYSYCIRFADGSCSRTLKMNIAR